MINTQARSVSRMLLELVIFLVLSKKFQNCLCLCRSYFKEIQIYRLGIQLLENKFPDFENSKPQLCVSFYLSVIFTVCIIYDC